jgi:hypothetical protein
MSVVKLDDKQKPFSFPPSSSASVGVVWREARRGIEQV